ncbi:hypothetical protein VB1_CDS0051 [Arthrobacter phage Marchesin]|nr:hypothetical protein VB1_CDS0051 [Arthrobacter phage Marchesin]
MFGLSSRTDTRRGRSERSSRRARSSRSWQYGPTRTVSAYRWTLETSRCRLEWCTRSARRSWNLPRSRLRSAPPSEGGASARGSRPAKVNNKQGALNEMKAFLLLGVVGLLCLAVSVILEPPAGGIDGRAVLGLILAVMVVINIRTGVEV